MYSYRMHLTYNSTILRLHSHLGFLGSRQNCCDSACDCKTHHNSKMRVQVPLFQWNLKRGAIASGEACHINRAGGSFWVEKVHAMHFAIVVQRFYHDLKTPRCEWSLVIKGFSYMHHFLLFLWVVTVLLSVFELYLWVTKKGEELAGLSKFFFTFYYGIK